MHFYLQKLSVSLHYSKILFKPTFLLSASGSKNQAIKTTKTNSNKTNFKKKDISKGFIGGRIEDLDRLNALKHKV